MRPSPDELAGIAYGKILDFLARKEAEAREAEEGDSPWDDYDDIEEVYWEFVEQQHHEREGEIQEDSRVEWGKGVEGELQRIHYDDDDEGEEESGDPDGVKEPGDPGPEGLLHALRRLVRDGTISKDRIRAFVDDL